LPPVWAYSLTGYQFLKLADTEFKEEIMKTRVLATNLMDCVITKLSRYSQRRIFHPALLEAVMRKRFRGCTRKVSFLIIVVVLGMLMAMPNNSFSNTYSITSDASNRWPGAMIFHAPCGVALVSGGGSTYMAPPPRIDFSASNSPDALCASLMRTLTDPDQTAVTTIGAVNPQYATLPGGIPMPPVSTMPFVPQDPQNAPTPYVEVSTSGSMQFIVPINWRDDSDTMFDGKFDGVVESPYDATICPNQTTSGAVIDPVTGFAQAASIRAPLCSITTPANYLSALKQGHKIGWAEVSYASVLTYGPTDTPAPGSQPWQKQTPGGMVAGALSIPYETENNSTVLRIALRYGTGFGGVAPLTWGGWPTPYCTSIGRGCLQPSDWAGMQTAWMPSQPFTVQIQPAYEVQFHILPTLILYQPPGNQSSSSISAQTSYTQTYQVDQASAITDQNEYDTKTKSDFSFDPGFNVAGFTGLVSFTDSTTWDNSTKTATGAQYATSVSSVVTQGVTSTLTTAKLDSSAPDVSHLTFQTEPFWSDQIQFAVNPQFAVWDYPSGQRLQPLGTSFIKAFSVAQLASCAPRAFEIINPAGIAFTYDILNPDNTSTHKQDQVTPSECAHLLSLDPFYVGLSQAAPPPMGISVPPATRPLSTAVRQDQSTEVKSYTTKSSYTKTFNATATSSRQNTKSSGITDGIFGSKLAASVDYTNTFTTTNQVGLTLGTTQTDTTQHTQTSTINLGDCPLVAGKSTCDAPLLNAPNVQVFQDTRFGTMMAVLPDLNIAPPAQAGSNWPNFGNLQTGGGFHIINNGGQGSTGSQSGNNGINTANIYHALGLTPLHMNLNFATLVANKPPITVRPPMVRSAIRAPSVPPRPAPPIRVGPGHAIPLAQSMEAQLAAKYPAVRATLAARVDGRAFANIRGLQRTANGKLAVVRAIPNPNATRAGGRPSIR
jgi:hypothetical protein